MVGAGGSLDTENVPIFIVNPWQGNHVDDVMTNDSRQRDMMLHNQSCQTSSLVDI